MNASNTRDKIVKAALKLFAEHGFEGASIRHIIELAGVNLAAVHYHFGSKETLFFAILDDRFVPLEKMRLEALARARSKGTGKLTTRRVVEAFIMPIAELIRGDVDAYHLAALIGRTFAENPGMAEKIVKRYFQRTLKVFFEAFREALPEMPPAEILWRLHFTIAAMAGTVSGMGRLNYLASSQKEKMDPDEVFDRLVDFVTAGFKKGCSSRKRYHRDG